MSNQKPPLTAEQIKAIKDKEAKKEKKALDGKFINKKDDNV